MAIPKEKIESVIRRIFEGETITRSLQIEGISAQSFYSTVSSDFFLEDAFARAQHAAATFRAEQMLDIADNEIDPNRARVQVDVRKWLASKMDPKKYGERIDVNIESRVDLRSVLEAARSRSPLLPPRDPPINVESVVIDITTQTHIETSDASSVGPTKSIQDETTPKLSIEDILS